MNMRQNQKALIPILLFLLLMTSCSGTTMAVKAVAEDNQIPIDNTEVQEVIEPVEEGFQNDNGESSFEYPEESADSLDSQFAGEKNNEDATLKNDIEDISNEVDETLGEDSANEADIINVFENEDTNSYMISNDEGSSDEKESLSSIMNDSETDLPYSIEAETEVLVSDEEGLDSDDSQSDEPNKENSVILTGKRYELPENGNYELVEEVPSFSTGIQGYSIGKALVKGSIVNSVFINGIPAYYVGEGEVAISYEIADVEDIDSFDSKGMSVIDDTTTKSVFGISLNGKKVHKGTLIIQSSKDASIWVTEKIIDNYFSSEKYEEELYSLNEIQIKNGCFFRIIVAYKKQIETEPTYFWFIKIPHYDTEKDLEIYEFYICSSEAISTSGTRYEIGTITKVKSAQGYSDELEMEVDDAHYGWSLGTFFVSGFSSSVEDADGSMVFLKNVGDRVTLGFELSEDINNLHNDANLKISIEKKGSDKKFQISTTEFGKGALIVQSRDYSNKLTGPTLFTNYLEAAARTSADNVIGLYEEGDYEVALDYTIEDKRNAFLGIPSYSYYTIRFKFKVRNGNCMVFPFDVKTNAELTNSSFTENGFRLDLANSRYLTINIEKEVLTSSGGSIVLDTRFNKAVPDGSSYTDEGIYTIKVKNKYTGLYTEKVIYVGTNPLIKAYVMTGLSLQEINQFLLAGYVIDDSGNIVLPNPSTDDLL